LAVAAFAIQAYLFVVALPATDADRTQRAFAAVVRRHFAPGESPGAKSLVLYRTREIAYYLDPPDPIPEFYEPADLRTAVEHDSIRWVILHRRDRAALGDGVTDVFAEPLGSWDAPERAGTKLLLVRVAK
jgi:hypothetical protein